MSSNKNNEVLFLFLFVFLTYKAGCREAGKQVFVKPENKKL